MSKKKAFSEYNEEEKYRQMSRLISFTMFFFILCVILIVFFQFNEYRLSYIAYQQARLEYFMFVINNTNSTILVII